MKFCLMNLESTIISWMMFIEEAHFWHTDMWRGKKKLRSLKRSNKVKSSKQRVKTKILLRQWYKKSKGKWRNTTQSLSLKNNWFKFTKTVSRRNFGKTLIFDIDVDIFVLLVIHNCVQYVQFFYRKKIIIEGTDV